MEKKKQVVEELHRSVRKNFKRAKFQMRGIDDTFQIDLIEFIPYSRENRGYKYALVVIDVFSKYAWTIPLKNKTGKEVTTAMEKIFKESNRVCRNCQSDHGKEFYNKYFSTLMEKYKVNHYSTFSMKKASICERLNRTLLTKLWKHFSFVGNHKWINPLKDITKVYNKTFHQTIKMRPVDVNKANEARLLSSVYKENNSFYASTKNKLNIGDFVRISRYKSCFEKGYTPNWSTELFVIEKILVTEPITYTVKDLNGQLISGSFYDYELQKSEEHEVYLVERIIKKSDKKVYVKWLGFNDSHNSWINKNDLI